MNWTHLFPIEPGSRRPHGVTETHWRRLCAIAADIRGRTGERAWVDVVLSIIVFGSVDCEGRTRLIGLPDIYLYRGANRTDAPNLFDPVLDQFSVDEIVRYIGLARVDPKLKGLWADFARRAKENDEKESMGRRAADVAERSIRTAEKQYARLGMGKHYKGRALVDGAKA